METFQEKYFNERSRLRNAILSNQSIFNDIFNKVNDLFEQSNDKISEETKLVFNNENKFLIAEKNNVFGVKTLFVFSFGKEEKININNIYSGIEKRDLLQEGNFVLSVKKRICAGEYIDVQEKINFLNTKLEEEKEDGEEKIYMNERVKSCFLTSNNTLHCVYDFYQYLGINILPLFEQAEKENICYGNMILKGLKERINLIKSVCNSKYQEAYNHKIKNYKKFMIIKNDGYSHVIEINGADINIYETGENCSVKNIADGNIGGLPYKNTILKMENGVIVYFEKQTYEMIFRIVLQNIYLTLISEGKIQEEESTDQIMTYEYQKKLFCFFNNATEFDFISSVLLNRSGFKYDEKRRSFYGSNYGYVDLKNAETKTRKENISLSYINNSSPLKNNMYVLERDWIEGIKLLLNVLRKEKPLPAVHYGESPIASINEAIDYCEELIKFNRK